MLRQPVSLMTREVLSGLRDFKRLPHDSWYFIAGATLSTLNRPDEGARVLRFALNNGKDDESSSLDPQESLRISRRMREAMVKLAAISGLPKTINSLFALKSITPRECLDDPLSPSATLRPVQIHDIPTSQILQKGQRFFDSIYGKISKRVMGQMDRSGTEDLGLMARLMYGYILSNVSILTPAETSYVLIAGLIPQDVNPQLKGHLKGALNNGAKESEVRAVRDMVLQICRMYGMKSLECEDLDSYGWRKEVANL